MKYEPVKSAIKRWLKSYGWALEQYSKERVFAEGFRAGWKAHQRRKQPLPQNDEGRK